MRWSLETHLLVWLLELSLYISLNENCEMVCFGLQLRGKRGNVYILERNKHLICKIHLVSLSSFPLPLLLLLYTPFKEFLSINALCTFVHIYIWQLSSFRAPTLWFIDLTVATNAIFNTLV